MLLVYYLSVIVCFSLWKTVSVKMGGQLDKRMLHWQPAKCCIFQLSVNWRINYYYYYYYCRHYHLHRLLLQ